MKTRTIRSNGSSIAEHSQSTRVTLKTDHPVAVDSVDHLFPLGTMQDNYRSPAFTRKLIDLYPDASASVLDIGCSGGGFVKEVNEFGHLAVGLEGSDYSQRHRRAEWATIPDRLFTCDCTKPFSMSFAENGNTRPALFDAVTAWEFLEHIETEDLSMVFQNVAAHLNPETGIFVASVNLHSCGIEDHEYHATVQPEWWWRDMSPENMDFSSSIARWTISTRIGSVEQMKIRERVWYLPHRWRSASRLPGCTRRSIGRHARISKHGYLGVKELRRVADSALARAESLEAIVMKEA